MKTGNQLGYIMQILLIKPFVYLYVFLKLISLINFSIL